MFNWKQEQKAWEQLVKHFKREADYWLAIEKDKAKKESMRGEQ